MDIWDGPDRLPYELVLIIVRYFLNTKCETDHSRDSSPGFAVLLAPVGPVCCAGYAEGAGNGPEFSSSGGCDPGTGGPGGLESPELAHSPLGLHGYKRKRGRDPAQSSRSPSTKQTGRTFACPYYLHDRIRHSGCLDFRLTRLSDVRQHLLERVHYQPVHCPVCGVIFPGRLADARRLRDAHIQAEICERSPFPFSYPGITEDGEQRIRDIARHNRTSQVTEVQRWYMIWDFLFPGERHPDSPFLNDPPEFQRVIDWSNTIFDNAGGLWRELPIEPWTTAMDPQQQRVRMLFFIRRFIVLARGLVVQDASPGEGQNQADNSSYTGVNTPALSIVTANSAAAPPASSNLATEVSRPVHLSPIHVTGIQHTRGSRTLNQAEPSTSNLAAAGAPIPFRPANGPPVGVQQPAPPGGAAAIQHDPAIPSVAFGGFSFNIPANDDDWLSSMLSNEDAGADHNLDPYGEEDLGRD